MNHLQVFSHLYFGTNIFHSTFLKTICRFGNFITACMQKTQNKSGHSLSTRQNILIFHQNPLQHPISALSASHVIIYCEYDMFSTFSVKPLQLLLLTFTSSSSQRSNIALIACGASVGKYLKNLAINCEASLFSPGPPLTAPMM